MNTQRRPECRIYYIQTRVARTVSSYAKNFEVIAHVKNVLLLAALLQTQDSVVQEEINNAIEFLGTPASFFTGCSTMYTGATRSSWRSKSKGSSGMWLVSRLLRSSASAYSQ